MQIKIKQKKWLKRSFATILSLTLVASSFSITGIPNKVEAASVNPGGISKQPVMWLKADDGATINVDKTITDWSDQTGINDFTVHGTPKFKENEINFNPVVSISDNRGNLDSGALTKLVGDTLITYADAYAVFKNADGVIVGSSTGGNNYGPGIFSKEGGRFYAAGNGANSTYTTFNYPSNISQPRIANTDIGGTTHNARLDGKDQNLTNVVTFKPLLITPILGSTLSKGNGSNYLNFNGDIAEVILYDASTAEDRAKIETYLAVKYGITLGEGNVDYVASNDELVWKADSSYKYNIAGIAHDAAEGLVQKQSRSVNNGVQVAIGISAIADTNAANTGTLTNGQYLIWGDNGEDLSFTKPIGTTSKNHAERIWKVQNTGGVGQVAIAIPKNGVPADTTLFVSKGDKNFTSEHKLNEIPLNGEIYLSANVTLESGQYFTFATPAPELVSAKLDKIGSDGNQITLTFDQEMSSTDGTGFTITVDGTQVTPIFKVDPSDSKKLILTLPPGTDVIGKTVSVVYDDTLGKLKAKNTVPARPFTKDITIVDKSQLQAKATEVTELKPTNYTPESWANLQTALDTANEVLQKQNSTQKEIDDALSALTSAQNALKAPGPTSIVLERTITDGSKVTLTFNHEVVVTDLTGFTVLVDGTPVIATLTPSPNAEEVILTLPQGTDVTGKVVKVDYDGTGTLRGTNGVPVVDFTKVAEDPFSAGITITNPSTSTVNDSKPIFEGTVLVDSNTTTPSTVEIIITDESGKEINGEATVDANGNWSFTPPTDLPDGTYTLKVTAKEGNKIATKEEQFTIKTQVATVDKLKLQEKVDEGNSLLATNYTPDCWQTFDAAKKAAEAVLNDPNTTQAQVDEALANLAAAQNALVAKSGGLSALTPSTSHLSPNFSSNVTNYKMNVDYATSQLSFTTLPTNPDATVTMTVNGQHVTNGLVPLAVGANTVMVTVQDGTSTTSYIITVYRAYDTSSGSGGGSNWTPPTPSTEVTDTTKTKIKVALEIYGNNPMEKTMVEIERTKHANGEITDLVALTEANAKEAIEKAKQIGNNIARIVIPDVNDEVGKVTVEVPKQSLEMLRDNGLSLEISTENGHIAILHSSMDGINDNFYFRLVPVKKESERNAIEERVRVENVVRETLQSNDVRVVARPMTIETNMPNRPVVVTLPLRGVTIPTAPAERKVFLERLAVFIEHSDGEKKVVIPEVVTMEKEELGLRFTVDKFSTFTIIQVNEQELEEHDAYIKGFADGTFGPEKNVTRAQVATMIARILGYTDDQTVDYSPFKDIRSGHHAAGAIAFVKEAGIMNGDANGNFRASENITRAQMATVAANFKQLDIQENVDITFIDIDGHWAQWIIEANRNAGIINGREDGSFAPDQHLTRTQAVVMMNRMFERGPLNGVATPSFPDVKGTHWAFEEIEEAARNHSYYINEDSAEQLSK